MEEMARDLARLKAAHRPKTDDMKAMDRVMGNAYRQVKTTPGASEEGDAPIRACASSSCACACACVQVRAQREEGVRRTLPKNVLSSYVDL